jgi:prolyl-tRNA synthetase
MGFVCVECASKEHFVVKACEVGNIFKLGTRFSNDFGLGYTDALGKKQEVVMGCYGIGVSRIMGVIAEKFMDKKGLIWPENIAPFTHYMIVIGDHLEEAKKLAERLESEGATVLIDDRNTGFGAKAGDADLLGIPHRIVLSDKTLAQGGYELKGRMESESRIVPIR